MKKLLAGVAVAGCCATAAVAGLPEYGSRDGELACAGLLELGHRGAKLSDPTNVEVIAATAAAYGLFVGRLSNDAQPATAKDMKEAIDKLSTEEKNAYVQTCLAKASAIFGEAR